MSVGIDVGKRERRKLSGTRNRWMDMVGFCASSSGPGEPTKKTSKWAPQPAFLANTPI